MDAALTLHLGLCKVITAENSGPYKVHIAGKKFKAPLHRKGHTDALLKFI